LSFYWRKAKLPNYRIYRTRRNPIFLKAKYAKIMPMKIEQ
jgi:hypothetical protein